MSEQTQRPLDENPASQRHWLYGFNAGVLALVSLVVLIILAAITQSDLLSNHTKFDLSTGGLNSLSPASRKMLAQIDKKPEKYAIWSLFTDPSDQLKRDDPENASLQAGQRRQINDLLRLYQRTSGRITVEDRGDAARDDIEKQIRDKYAAEFKPYQEAVDAFDPLAKKLSDFMKTEAEAIGAFAQKPGTPPDEAQAAAMIQAQFASFPDELADDQRAIHREVDQYNLPDWGALKQNISERIDQMEPVFALLGDAEKLKAAMDAKRLPPTLGAFFTGRNDRYKSIAAELKGYKTQLDDLKPLKVQDVLSSLSRNAVVILGADMAKVISYGELFTQTSTGGRSGESGISFNGEQAISSALYAMANPDKVKVVFVTAAPQHMLDDLYSDMKQVLEDANFDVLEWSPPGPNAPGGMPPASGRGVVWVVFPPESPSMQMMMAGMGMPDPQPVIAATRRHMANGGQVLFMAESGGGGMFGGGGPYPYADLVKDFGIEVQSKYTIQHEQTIRDPDTGQETQQNSPFIGLDDQPWFAKHEITTPVEGLPAIFGPMLTNQGAVGATTVVKVLAPVPSGVEAMELVKTPRTSDFWASTDSSPTEKFNPATDMPAPVPLMAVAVKDKGKKGPDGTSEEQRIAVLGSKMLGSNFFLDLNVRVLYGGMPVLVPRFPGNAELMKNTILWLAGYENMIAVSAKADAAARLGHVSTLALVIVKLVVWGLAPLIPLVLLIVVWAVRHR